MARKISADKIKDLKEQEKKRDEELGKFSEKNRELRIAIQLFSSLNH